MNPTNEKVQALIALENLCSEFEECPDCPLYICKFDCCGLDLTVVDYIE